jgi:BioD-like phosphotransacetylase family protein
MCRKIFVAATGQHTGKTTISLSLVHLARQQYARVGFIKPIGPKCQSFNGIVVDKDAALLARIYGLEEDIALMSPLVLGRGSTKEFLDGARSRADAERLIADACRELEQKCDFLVVEGSGHGGVGSVIGLNNARVAALVGAPVVMVAGGGIGSVIDSVELNLPLYQREGVDLRLLLINKLLPEKRDEALGYLQRAFAPAGLTVAGAFDYSPVLANPTLAHISRLLDQPLQGDQTQRNRIVHHIQLGAASSQKVIDGLLPSTLLVTTSSRDELIVTVSSLYHIPAYREKIAGLVIPGNAPVSEITGQILRESGVPFIRIPVRTAEAFSAITDHVSKISAEDTEKIDLIKASAEAVLSEVARQHIL